MGESLKKGKFDKISVVFPIFGNFDSKRLYLSVESVKNQDYPNIEIVVSEQNDKPLYKETAKKQRVKYVFSKKKVNDNYDIGYVRNKGIINSLGKYVYLDDSDIVFMNKAYLSLVYRNMKKTNALYISNPPMKRLAIENFEEFYLKTRKQGISNAIKLLKFDDGYSTSTTRKIHVIRYGWRKRRMTAFDDEWKKIDKKDLKTNYGYGLLSFTMHPGTIFAERKKLIDVGGYCEGFRGWGCEDTDLKVKLSRFYKTKEIPLPKKKSYWVLHLDHERNFKKEKYDLNEKLYDERVKSPIKKVVFNDKKQQGIRNK